MKTVQNVHDKKAIITPQQALNTTLTWRINRATNLKLKISDQVLMLRENPVGKWISPYIVEHVGETANDRHWRMNSNGVHR